MSASNHMKLYEAKINLLRFDEIEPLISPRAVFWFTDGTHRGIAEIRAAFERTWTAFQDEFYWLEEIEWIGSSDTLASCTYRFCWRKRRENIRREWSRHDSLEERKWAVENRPRASQSLPEMTAERRSPPDRRRGSSGRSKIVGALASARVCSTGRNGS